MSAVMLMLLFDKALLLKTGFTVFALSNAPHPVVDLGPFGKRGHGAFSNTYGARQTVLAAAAVARALPERKLSH